MFRNRSSYLCYSFVLGGEKTRVLFGGMASRYNRRPNHHHSGMNCVYHPRHPILILCAHISPTPTRTTRVLGIGTVFSLCHPVSGGYNQANERYKPTKFHCAFLLRRERQVILEAVAFVAGLRLRISDLFDSCWAYSKFFVIYYCIALTGNDNEDVLQAIVPSPKVR